MCKASKTHWKMLLVAKKASIGNRSQHRVISQIIRVKFRKREVHPGDTSTFDDFMHRILTVMINQNVLTPVTVSARVSLASVTAATSSAVIWQGKTVEWIGRVSCG